MVPKVLWNSERAIIILSCCQVCAVITANQTLGLGHHVAFTLLWWKEEQTQLHHFLLSFGRDN